MSGSNADDFFFPSNFAAGDSKSHINSIDWK